MSMTPGGTSRSPQFAPEHRALRLIFEYEGDQVRLVARQALEKVTRPSDPIEQRDRAGFWIDLLDRQGQTIYRQVLFNPIATSVEVPSGDPERPLMRVPVDQPRGTFIVIVPDLPNAQAVALFSSPIDSRDPAAAGQPAREIARIDLRTTERAPRPESPPTQTGSEKPDTSREQTGRPRPGESAS